MSLSYIDFAGACKAYFVSHCSVQLVLHVVVCKMTVAICPGFVQLFGRQAKKIALLATIVASETVDPVGL